MILEHAPFGRRGFFASFTLQGVQAGQILAAAIFLPLNYILSAEDFAAWGWRIPFLLSAVVLIAGVLIRRNVEETPAFEDESQSGATPRAPVMDALGTMLTALLPALFALVAPPGSQNVPLLIGSLALGVTVIASIAAFTARETYRVHLNDLGEPGAQPVDVATYAALRGRATA